VTGAKGVSCHRHFLSRVFFNYLLISLSAHSHSTPRLRCTKGHTLALSPLFSAIPCVLSHPPPHSLWCALPLFSTGQSNFFSSAPSPLTLEGPGGILPSSTKYSKLTTKNFLHPPPLPAIVIPSVARDLLFAPPRPPSSSHSRQSTTANLPPVFASAAPRRGGACPARSSIASSRHRKTGYVTLNVRRTSH
jgi:hypothetical protein